MERYNYYVIIIRNFILLQKMHAFLIKVTINLLSDNINFFFWIYLINPLTPVVSK